MFSIDFFRHNPVPFNMLIRHLLPGAHKPTPTHAFLRMLCDQGKLLRVCVSPPAPASPLLVWRA